MACMAFPTTSVLENVQRLYDEGLFLKAFETALVAGPLVTWRGAAGRILAGRLAGRLGGHRLSSLQHWLAYREHPREDAAIYFQARRLWHRRGPLAAWRFLTKCGAPHSTD